jgi:hypothetical protein
MYSFNFLKRRMPLENGRWLINSDRQRPWWRAAALVHRFELIGADENEAN